MAAENRCELCKFYAPRHSKDLDKILPICDQPAHKGMIVSGPDANCRIGKFLPKEVSGSGSGQNPETAAAAGDADAQVQGPEPRVQTEERATAVREVSEKPRNPARKAKKKVRKRSKRSRKR